MAVFPDIFVHVPIAVGVMLAGWIFGRMLGISGARAVWAGWFAGACTCIMREITQHEYRWIEAFGAGKRANLPPLEGLKVWDWTRHSQLETLGALALSAVLAVGIARLG